MNRRGRPKLSRDVTQTCLQCGAQWLEPEWRHRVYCSRTCFFQSRVGVPRLDLRRETTKVCERCNNTFKVGGAGNKKRSARFCSIPCTSAGLRQVHSEPLVLSVVDAAYVAGFFDGEGSIIRTKPRTWRIVIYQCDESVIRWIREIMGTGLVASRKSSSKNLVKQSELKLGWVWQIYGRNAALVIRQIYPYLRVKKARAEEMLRDYE